MYSQLPPFNSNPMASFVRNIMIRRCSKVLPIFCIIDGVGYLEIVKNSASAAAKCLRDATRDFPAKIVSTVMGLSPEMVFTQLQNQVDLCIAKSQAAEQAWRSVKSCESILLQIIMSSHPPHLFR